MERPYKMVRRKCNTSYSMSRKLLDSDIIGKYDSML